MERFVRAILVSLACALLLVQEGTAQPSSTNAPQAQFAPKKTIFVGTFESADIMGGSATADGLSAMLTEALVRDGRFVVVERIAYPDIQAEQAIHTAGQTTAETGPKPGQMIGAGLIVRGTVTKFSDQAKGGSFNVGGLNLLGGGGGDSLGLNRSEAVCTITLRFIDTTTGQVISTSTADGTAASSGVNADVLTKSGVEFGGQAFNNTPLGQAAQAAIKKAVQQIALAAENTPWATLVADNAGGQVYIAAGANAGMQAGATLHVYRSSRTVTDPSTGVVLDTFYDTVGTILVTQVRDKISIASVASGNQPIRGDIVKLQ